MKILFSMITGALIALLVSHYTNYGASDYQWWVLCAPVWILSALYTGTFKSN